MICFRIVVKLGAFLNKHSARDFWILGRSIREKISYQIGRRRRGKKEENEKKKKEEEKKK